MRPVVSERYGRFASRVEGFRGWCHPRLACPGVVQPLCWWPSGDTDAMWFDRLGQDDDQPFAVVTPAAPAVPLLYQHTRGGLREGGDALCPSLVRQRVSTLTSKLAVNQRFLPGLGQGDQGDAAESELPATATDDEALNPAAGTAGLDEEVQSVAIGVPSGRSGAQEGGREGVAGVAAGGFGFGSGRCEVAYSIHPPIIWR